MWASKKLVGPGHPKPSARHHGMHKNTSKINGNFPKSKPPHVFWQRVIFQPSVMLQHFRCCSLWSNSRLHF